MQGCVCTARWSDRLSCRSACARVTFILLLNEPKVQEEWWWRFGCARDAVREECKFLVRTPRLPRLGAPLTPGLWGPSPSTSPQARGWVRFLFLIPPPICCRKNYSDYQTCHFQCNNAILCCGFYFGQLLLHNKPTQYLVASNTKNNNTTTTNRYFAHESAVWERLIRGCLSALLGSWGTVKAVGWDLNWHRWLEHVASSCGLRLSWLWGWVLRDKGWGEVHECQVEALSLFWANLQNLKSCGVTLPHPTHQNSHRDPPRTKDRAIDLVWRSIISLRQKILSAFSLMCIVNGSW